MRIEDEIIHKCLNMITKEEQEMIALVFFEHRSLSEAARIMGMPRNTFRYRMQKGLKHLQEVVFREMKNIACVLPEIEQSETCQDSTEKYW